MYYKLQVSLNPDFTDLVLNTVVKNLTEFTFMDELQYFTKYWWRVKAIDPQNGNTSNWSEPCMFKVQAEDIIIQHIIDRYECDDENNIYNSYIIYNIGEHKFIRSYDYECIIPDAQLGWCLGNFKGKAEIGVICRGGEKVAYCPGVCQSEFGELQDYYILLEDGNILNTEFGLNVFVE